MRTGFPSAPFSFIWLLSFSALTNTTLAYKLHRRAATEHVVLTNCVDENGYKSSEMAYYPAAPGTVVLQDYANVTTSPGTHRAWENTITSATFPTKVIFNANLGDKVQPGEYAGSGENGYGEFSCWGGTGEELYWHYGKVCSMVYDCDHRPKPESASSSTTTTTTIERTESTTPPTSTSTPIASTDLNPESSAKSSQGSRENITQDESAKGETRKNVTIGAIVGGVLGLIGLTAIVFIFGCLWKRQKRARANTRAELGSHGQLNELGAAIPVELAAEKKALYGIHEVSAGSVTELPANVPVQGPKDKGYGVPVELSADMPVMRQVGYEPARSSMEKR